MENAVISKCWVMNTQRLLWTQNSKYFSLSCWPVSYELAALFCAWLGGSASSCRSAWAWHTSAEAWAPVSFNYACSGIQVQGQQLSRGNLLHGYDFYYRSEWKHTIPRKLQPIPGIPPLLTYIPPANASPASPCIPHCWCKFNTNEMRNIPPSTLLTTSHQEQGMDR